MAIGTITVDQKEHAPGHIRTDLLHFVGDSSYPTNGMPILALIKAALGVGTIQIMAVVPNDCGGYVVAYVPSTGKLKVYYSNSDSSDGPLIEVPDTTALNGVTFNLLVISR